MHLYREKLEEVMVKKPDFALSYIKFIGLSLKKSRIVIKHTV